MKKIIFIIIIATFFSKAFTQNVVFHEGFEEGYRPTGWTEEKVLGFEGEPTGALIQWQYLEGGYGFDPGIPDDRGYPDHAAQGEYNAMFQLESYKGETTILITPPIDLSDVTKPELLFEHVQATWYFNNKEFNDILNVYYKTGPTEDWVLLESYENAVEDWTLRSILLPDSSLSNTYYVGFEGITGFGYGTCIDTVRILETGIVSEYLESHTIEQASTNFIPTNTLNNPILKITLEVNGNDGFLYLDSLKVKSLNSDDNNLVNNGVKLYYTEDVNFNDPILITNGVANFVNGVASFKNLGHELERGINTIWVTYDIAPAANHDVHNNILDAKIEAESMYIGGSAYPFADKSPDGERLLKETIFNDGFETGGLLWTMGGSFEVDIPQGLNAGTNGYPDPETAYNGSNVLGTDLTTDGLYDNNSMDSAISPSIDCYYYKDVNIYYARWFNAGGGDLGFSDYSTDNGLTWERIWQNDGAVVDNSWELETFDVDNIDFQENVKVRFYMYTTEQDQYTGWNVDDFTLIGDFISKDVGITEITLPETGCGHTSSDDITVTIENFAGEATPTTIPVRYEIDGSGTYVIDAYTSSSIGIGGTSPFTFSVGADLSAPGYHTIKVETILPGDEISTNNTKSKTIFSYPTYSLPYAEDFETNNGYFLRGGFASSWEHGKPASVVINAAASGDYAWVTNLKSYYLNGDSSYIESPCFDFTGSDSIIFEFKAIGVTEDKTDGLTLLYSLDQGVNWNVVPDDEDFYWNWYNEPLISELELPGIDTTDGEWKTFRQLLPPDVKNESSVKFRFMFESNGAIRYEGFGIDDVKIYDAPYDVGVSDITEPFTDCYWDEATQVKVDIENFGITAVKAGTKIPIGLKMNDVHIITDTLELASDLALGASTSFTFTETVDMSAAGDYEFEAYTLLEDDPYFYDETTCNDTSIEIVTVQGMPDYNPFQDQIGVNPVDTFLVAGKNYDSYFWDRPVLDDTTTLTTDTLYIKDYEGWYKVTVTNADNCTASDSVEVVSSLIDIEMLQIYTILDTVCERTELSELSVQIKNNGVDLNVDDSVFLAYQINDLPKVQDTLIATSPIVNGDTEDFTFTEKADFITPDSYTLKIFVDYLKDLNHYDDTLTDQFLTQGYVDIDFNPDTIFSSEADTLVLSPEPDYSTYSWSTLESTPSITPTTNVSQWYYVTVSDGDETCGSDDDSVYVETYDFAIDSIKSPHSDCAFTNAENIELYVFNHSGNTYATGTKIPFRFNFDGLGWVDDTVTLTSDFSPETTEIITLNKTIDPSVVKEYSLEVKVNAKQDANQENDAISHNFETWGYPSVDLPYETIFTTQADTVVLEVSDEFGTYSWNQDVNNDSSIFVVSDNFSQNYIVTVSDIHGCGTDKDSTFISTYNVGVLELVSPTSDCEHDFIEHITVKIKNFSNDIMKKDSIIPVGYKLDGANAVIEYMTLDQDLSPSGTVNYTFSETEDLSSIETYHFELFTDLVLDVKHSNDTLVDVIKTFGYPSINLGDDILTTQPDTVVIVAAPGFKGYFWDDGTNNDSLEITYLASRLYTVTVNDINGCKAIDDINVFTYNLATSEIVSPVSKCELSNSETVSFDVINNSLDTLLENDVINVRYTINSGSPVNESFALEVDSLKPGETVNYTFTQTADLSNNQDYTFSLYAEYPSYDTETNDAINRDVDYQKTELALGPDINTGEAQHTIDAGDFKSYLWFDEETTTRTYTVDINDQNPNYYYAVTVTNDYDCVDYDSIQVTFSTTASIDLTDMPTPVDACWQESETYPVKVIITNSGVVNLNSGTGFTVEYNVDGGTPVVETFDISETMTSGDTKEYTFTEEVSFATAKVYTIETSVKLTNDESITDNLSTNIDISAPEVSLGLSDTISFEVSTQLSTSVPYTTYEWSTGAETPTITVTEEGKYSVTVTDANGCQGEGWIYCKKGTTGIDHLIKGSDYQISFYPNPVSDQLMIQFDNQKSKDVFVEILSSNGQIIYTRKLDDIENTIERIDVNPYANGIYYLRIQVDQELYTRKVIIQ